LGWVISPCWAKFGVTMHAAGDEIQNSAEVLSTDPENTPAKFHQPRPSGLRPYGFGNVDTAPMDGHLTSFTSDLRRDD